MLEFPKLGRASKTLNVRFIASREEPFAVLEFKLGDDFCQISTRPRAGARGWKRVAYLYDSIVIPVQPDSSSTHLVPNTETVDPSQSSNHFDDPDLDDQISLARLTETQSQSENDSDEVTGESSENILRHLSSVATLTTYAPGDDSPDFAIERELVEIDFERRKHLNRERTPKVNHQKTNLIES